jgi:uncharacterized membrane protein YcjF (UPF0283 family)
MTLHDKFAHLRHGVPGETYVDDPRERRLRVIAQLIDKPLFILLAMAGFALAARGPGWVVPGYQPSGWFVLGLWICFIIAVRMVLSGLVAWFRLVFAIPAPTAD